MPWSAASAAMSILKSHNIMLSVGEELWLQLFPDSMHGNKMFGPGLFFVPLQNYLVIIICYFHLFFSIFFHMFNSASLCGVFESDILNNFVIK